MKNQLKKLSFLFLMAAFTILGTACSGGGGDGGGGGGGGPGGATLSADNAQALAIAGTEGVKQAVNNSDSSSFFFAKTGNQSPVQKLTVLAAQQASQGPALASDVFNFCESGSVTGFDTFTQSGSGTITFTNCVMEGATVNGTMTITSSVSGDIMTLSMNANLTVVEQGETETINYSATCTFDQVNITSSCTYDGSVTDTGFDGRTYSVSDIEVSGDDSNGYTVSATVTDPDHGVITITTTTPVTLNCSNGQPDAGVIVVSDGSNTMTVTFSGCSGYSIDFNGSTTTYTWL